MSAEPAGMQISIMGREFRVACAPDEQKSLQEAVDFLNRKMQEIKDQGRSTALIASPSWRHSTSRTNF